MCVCTAFLQKCYASHSVLASYQRISKMLSMQFDYNVQKFCHQVCVLFPKPTLPYNPGYSKVSDSETELIILQICHVFSRILKFLV